MTNCQQTGGQGVAELVELPAADHAVEVPQRVARGVPGESRAEHAQGVVELDLVVGRLVAVEGEPRSFVVVAHGSPT
jgi:hypothetical protein